MKGGQIENTRVISAVCIPPVRLQLLGGFFASVEPTLNTDLLFSFFFLTVRKNSVYKCGPQLMGYTEC